MGVGRLGSEVPMIPHTRAISFSAPTELARVLMALRDATGLELAGLFGYEGHVVHTPLETSDAARAAWDDAMGTYRALVRVLESFPRRFRGATRSVCRPRRRTCGRCVGRLA